MMIIKNKLIHHICIQIIIQSKYYKCIYITHMYSMNDFSKCKEIVFKIRLNENEYNTLINEKNKRKGNVY